MKLFSTLPVVFSLFSGLLGCAEDGAAPTSEDGEPDEQAIYTDNGGANGPTGRRDVEAIGLINVNGGKCSGIIIGPRTALSATHCELAVGQDIQHASDHYSIARLIDPPAALATAWGPYDVTIIVLDRDVLEPGTTNTKFIPYARITTRTIGIGETLVCNGAGPNAVDNGTHINTGLIDGASNGYHWGAFDIVDVGPGAPFYRVVPGVASGDSGGPCFLPTEDGSIFLAGLNSSSAGVPGEHPESSAIVSIADQAAAVRWILQNTR